MGAVIFFSFVGHSKKKKKNKKIFRRDFVRSPFLVFQEGFCELSWPRTRTDRLDRSTQLAGVPGTFFSYMMCGYEVSLKENPLGKGMVIHYFVLSFSSVGVRGTKLGKNVLYQKPTKRLLSSRRVFKERSEKKGMEKRSHLLNTLLALPNLPEWPRYPTVNDDGTTDGGFLLNTLRPL